MLVANAARAAERRFLAKMSHEIRTPLNAIIGMSHILEDTPLSEEQSKFVNAISQGGALLKELLDSVLDIARLEEGRKELNMRSTTLRPIFDGIMVVYKPLMINKGISLELEWDGGAGWILQARRASIVSGTVEFGGQCGQIHRSRFYPLEAELIG